MMAKLLYVVFQNVETDFVLCTFLPLEPTSAGGLSDMLPLLCGTIFHLLSGNQAH